MKNKFRGKKHKHNISDIPIDDLVAFISHLKKHNIKGANRIVGEWLKGVDEHGSKRKEHTKK